MRILPSTIVIASVGAAVTASAIALLVAYGYGLGEWWPLCLAAILIGIPVMLGAVVREFILRAPPGRYRKVISEAALGGMDIGLGDSGGHGSGDGGGADGGGGDGGGGH